MNVEFIMMIPYKPIWRERFPSLQLTFYHTEKADVKCSSQKMAPHVQVRCIHLQAAIKSRTGKEM